MFKRLVSALILGENISKNKHMSREVFKVLAFIIILFHR